MKYAAFDLEIATDLPEGDDWHSARPLGITCAGVATESDVRTFPGAIRLGEYNPQMSQTECASLVCHLATQHVVHGRKVVSWNGLGFDFDVLLEESHCPAILARLVPDHVDIAFAMLCDKGFMCGLNAAATGMKVGEKMEGVHGKDAPSMWKKGREQQDIVLEYVGQDARITGLVYEAVTELGYLEWIAKSGRPNKWKIPRSGIPTVREAIGRPLPNTSWMTNPWPREKFSKWLLALMFEQGVV